MKLSARASYGLKAILVLASRYGEGSLSVSHIAKREDISVPYLEQILHALKKKGLVKSVRGPQGGYVLAQKPAEIALNDLFHALEGDLGTDKASARADEISLGSHLFWQKFSSSIDKGLSQSNLKELMDEARKHQKPRDKGPSPTFHI